jgi:hypothetical protein
MTAQPLGLSLVNSETVVMPMSMSTIFSISLNILSIAHNRKQNYDITSNDTCIPMLSPDFDEHSM